MSAVLEVEDLTISFRIDGSPPVDAVRGVSFEVQKGERLGLVGESGCGKSTTLLGLMGLLPNTAVVGGNVRIDGEDIMRGGPERLRAARWSEVAMVFQGAMNAFNPVKTIGWQIVEAMEVKGTYSGKAAERRTGELLETVGISADRAARFPHEFSGGMRQRAALAMALANDPKVLLADEPTTALDVMVQAQILDLLERLSDELDLALVLVTHDLPMVTETCRRAAIMYAGLIVEEGPTETLYRDPHHPYTRLLFEAMPEIGDDREVASIPGAPPRMDREIVGCSFAPRCPSAMDICRTDEPRTITVGQRHIASCHLNDLPLDTKSSAGPDATDAG
ncbi:MAG: ABC transporter ATP-binding protein [Actinomycetes bacterium]